jgi:hypothetical protein
MNDVTLYRVVHSAASNILGCGNALHSKNLCFVYLYTNKEYIQLYFDVSPVV